MKRISTIISIALTATMLIFTGCNGKTKKAMQTEIDSLQVVNQSYDQQMSEMGDLIDEVLQNFQQITSMEGMINVNPKKGDLPKSSRDKIRDNFKLIGEKLKENKENIAQLNGRLRKIGRNNTGLQKTINSLQEMLEVKTQQITKLSEQMQQQEVIIASLDNKVSELDQQNQKLTEKVVEQGKALNKVSYCIGTSKDLKDYNIIKDGELVTDGYSKDYFTQIDLTKVRSIPLYAKRASLITEHPESSYKLVRADDKNLTLEITDAQAFWSLSKILVIKVR